MDSAFCMLQLATQTRDSISIHPLAFFWILHPSFPSFLKKGTGLVLAIHQFGVYSKTIIPNSVGEEWSNIYLASSRLAKYRPLFPSTSVKQLLTIPHCQ